MGGGFQKTEMVNNFFIDEAAKGLVYIFEQHLKNGVTTGVCTC